ncbi:tetratricopeptide repeat protein [Dongia sp. agr-C8]
MRFVCAQPAGAALAGDHLMSLLLVAPEIAGQFPVPTKLRDSFRFSREGNPPAWTQRTAHGVADFLQAFLNRAGATLSVAFTHADAADPTDRELFDILRQRCDPARLGVACEGGGRCDSADLLAGARGFLRAGSAVWRGSDFEDVTDAATVLLRASDLAMRMATYDAALEWAALGRTELDAAAVEDWGKLTRNMLFALLLLGRIPEAEAICAEVQGRPAEPAILAHVTYAMAILNARLYDRARHDYDAAKAWIERSLEYTARLPASETRSVNHAFLMNTMALVEMRKGRQDAARALLDDALALMEAEAPERFPLECGILLHNRAKLHRAMKQPERAIGDLTLLLRYEPSSGEAYFDRGLLQQRAGRYQAALADYDAALSWSPPYWEPHFNRAQVRIALGERDGALRDYERVLVLHPEHVESRAHACCLRGIIALEAQDLESAARNFTASLEADPNFPDAWANRATVHYRQGDAQTALRDLDHALVLREDAEVLYNRGRVLESLERRREAIADYRRALALGASGAEAIQRRLDHCRALDQGAHGQPATPAV